jgi:hypothetical protein
VALAEHASTPRRRRKRRRAAAPPDAGLDAVAEDGPDAAPVEPPRSLRGPVAEIVRELGATLRAAPVSDPSEALAAVLSLRGAVELTEWLERSPPPATGPVERGAAMVWSDWLARRRTAVVRSSLRPLDQAVGGRHGLPEADGLFEALAEAGALAATSSRAEAAIARVAAAEAGPFHGLVASRMGAARAAFATLRRDLGEQLTLRGGAVAWLDELDAAVRRHTDERADERFGRLAAATRRRFADDLWSATQALPRPAAPSHVHLWYSGWIADHIDLCRRVVRAVCEHEWRALHGLAAAASALVTAES